MRIRTHHDFTDTVDIVRNTLQDFCEEHHKISYKYYDPKGFVQYFKRGNKNSFFSSLLANKRLVARLESETLIEPPAADVCISNTDTGKKSVQVYIANMDLINMLAGRPQCQIHELELLVESDSSSQYDMIHNQLKKRLTY